MEAGTDEDTPGGRKAQTIFGLEELNLSQNGLQVLYILKERSKQIRTKKYSCTVCRSELNLEDFGI